MMNNFFHQEFLKDVFAQKVQRNRSYSWRAFARDLNISHSTLLGVINGKRLPNFNMALGISNKLKLNNQLSLIFLDSINKQKLKKGLKSFQKKLDQFIEKNAPKDNPKIKYLNEKDIKHLSDWFYYAILELFEVENFQFDSKWISQRLKISEQQVQLAISRLKKIGLIRKVNQKWIKTSFNISTKAKDKTSNDLMNIQKSFLKKSIESIETTSYDQRIHNGMTIGINPNKLPQAKEEIRKFLYNLSELLENDTKKEVYELQVSLFPLTHSTNKDNS